jgi:Flp pilus assembly protein TadD
LLKDSQQAEALRYAERAITLAPESALVIDTLAMVYLGNGDVVQAKALIDRALQKQPKNPSYLFHKAVIAESSGDAQHAVHSLQQALALGTDFPEKQAAQEMLRRLRGS